MNGSQVTCVSDGCETAIELLSFTAAAHVDGAVTLAWRTATEVDNAGFNLYRAWGMEGSFTKINAALVPAQGTAVTGASYHFVDRSGYGTFRYMLEDVDYYGVNTLHGPIYVRVKRP